MAEGGEEEGSINDGKVVVDRHGTATGDAHQLRGAVVCELAQQEGSSVLITCAAVILQLDKVAILLRWMKALPVSTKRRLSKIVNSLIRNAKKSQRHYLKSRKVLTLPKNVAF